MQKLTLFKLCWVGDLYRSYFCLSPSPRLVHGTVSNRTFSYIFNNPLQSVVGILLVAWYKKKRTQRATDDIWNRGLVEEFANDPIHDGLELSQRGNHP